MQQYKYVAQNLQKVKFTGSFIAENELDLAIQLQKQGLYLISAKSYNSNVKKSFFSLSVSSGVSINELNSFSRQFAIMINSGIPILGCLDILKDQKYSTMFREVLVVICDDVRAGMMFSEALNKHKKIFPDFFRSMVSVGEKSGKMDIVLNSLADYYERDAASKRKLKSALSYPIMLGIMTVGIVALMLAYVVPTFRTSLSGLNITPTGLTKAVYDLSDFIVEDGLKVLAIAFSVIALFFLYSKTESGKYKIDEFKVTFPIVSSINIATVTSRFASSLGLLLTSGMDVVEAMEAAVIVFNNRYLEKKYRKAIEDVKHGTTMAAAFEKYKLFPEILTQMVAIGEKTNALSDVLTRSSSFFAEKVDEAIGKITSTIQPVMLCIMGGIIGTLFIAIYSPMLDIMGSF